MGTDYTEYMVKRAWQLIGFKVAVTSPTDIKLIFCQDD